MYCISTVLYLYFVHKEAIKNTFHLFLLGLILQSVLIIQLSFFKKLKNSLRIKSHQEPKKEITILLQQELPWPINLAIMHTEIHGFEMFDILALSWLYLI